MGQLRVLTVLFLGALAFVNGQELECPLFYNVFNLEEGGPQTCLLFVIEQDNWNYQRTSCQENGGLLMQNVTDNLQVEIANYIPLVDDYYGVSFFVGGTDLNLDGTWLFNDGSSMENVIWAPNEPDGGIGENCACLCPGTFLMCSCTCTNSEGAICQTSLREKVTTVAPVSTTAKSESPSSETTQSPCQLEECLTRSTSDPQTDTSSGNTNDPQGTSTTATVTDVQTEESSTSDSIINSGQPSTTEDSGQSSSDSVSNGASTTISITDSSRTTEFVTPDPTNKFSTGSSQPTTDSITDGSSTRDSITDESPTTDSITDGSSTRDSITDESPTTDSITDGSPTTDSITDGSPTTDSITDESPTRGSASSEPPTTAPGNSESTSNFPGSSEQPSTDATTDRPPTTDLGTNSDSTFESSSGSELLTTFSANSDSTASEPLSSDQPSTDTVTDVPPTNSVTTSDYTARSTPRATGSSFTYPSTQGLTDDVTGDQGSPTFPPYDVDCPLFYAKYYLDEGHNNPTCLRVVAEFEYWNTHRSLCLLEDAKLVKTTPEIQRQLIDYLPTIPTFVDRNFYIGANDIVEEGEWVWNDEDSMEGAIWANGEPNGMDDQNCACLCPPSFLICDCPCEIYEYAICQTNGTLV